MRNTSNNEAEYEVLLAGTNIALNNGTQRIKIYIDSQLVVEQLNGSFEGKDEKMIKLLCKVEERKKNFDSFELVQIPREESIRANSLARIRSQMKGQRPLKSHYFEFDLKDEFTK
ncbi:UNVERIFIED_CONTAM: hypothetical protein Sradi_2659600 [Sesamum radiatum]|uniref:RNase H type-1 domain-containing protein n=1 Tax=Sesamum radiatum TaxID=300843 RepID=A0AAW2S5M8_SESRA